MDPIGRVVGKTAVVVGGGQAPGATVGNGRAAAVLFAREGAKVLVADRHLASAEETAGLIRSEGGTAAAVEVDVTREADIERLVAVCVDTWGGLDILHNNVGISEAGGDAPVTEITPEAFTRIMEINLLGMVLACKHALPIMREQGRGAIVNISSVAVKIDYPWVTYQTSKAGVVTLTEHLAITNAPYGVRANVILPGLIDTPMAVERHVRDGMTRDEVVARRSARTPLKGRPGNAWDVAHAALFLASDEAGFVTGATLTVDGGQTLVVG
ncbi:MULTISPECIES: SDR family NAD(P)-dependent oxidoreductase [unclassified Pseudofrankia]|uniref:SDR family NAD(P)-dependent oxidoreductase n=1 Tax=unclassified Pseudofrankia TaxID=2994372 RepID=UPI0008DB285D|nr:MULTISPECIES: SDR family NAD(P)-dependent oxidoreductase [unclassified Pseudofrankia]MDT3444930.1 SDR family NAD(P)-dependent oxidoreductase [Pseudofrankia sp. BMG5.37]OHV64835.1 3-oxoacyl-ACP reductase [Pseudofrankia sp. BMG5.36]